MIILTRYGKTRAPQSTVGIRHHAWIVKPRSLDAKAEVVLLSCQDDQLSPSQLCQADGPWQCLFEFVNIELGPLPVGGQNAQRKTDT